MRQSLRKTENQRSPSEIIQQENKQNQGAHTQHASLSFFTMIAPKKITGGTRYCVPPVLIL